MTKLGYTWYPKDYQYSDRVFELNLAERGLYRELIDLAMMEDNKVEMKIETWVRKFNSTIEEIKNIIEKLAQLTLVEVDENTLKIPSCEKRLSRSRAGRKGGKISKRTSKDVSKTEANAKQTLNQKKRKESKRKEKEDKRETKNDPFNSSDWKKEIDLSQVGVLGKFKSIWKTKHKFYYFSDEDNFSLKSIHRVLKSANEKAGFGTDDETVARSFKKYCITHIPEFYTNHDLSTLAKKINAIIMEVNKRK